MKVFLALLLFLFVSWAVSAAPDPRLVAIDRLTAFDGDVSALYTIVHRDGAGTTSARSAAVFRRDRDRAFLVVSLEASGKPRRGYLRLGDGLWLYDAQSGQFTLTGAQERFGASNFRLSDFTGSRFAQDYEVKGTGQETLGRFDCTVLDLAALRTDVVIPRVRLWVSADNLVRKSEDSGLSGDVVRSVSVPSWQRAGDRYLPNSVVVSEPLKQEQTEITVTKVGTRTLDNGVFTKEFLERLAR